MGRCKGITSAGLPCKLQVPDGEEYCRFHKDQERPSDRKQEQVDKGDPLIGCIAATIGILLLVGFVLWIGESAWNMFAGLVGLPELHIVTETATEPIESEKEINRELWGSRESVRDLLDRILPSTFSTAWESSPLQDGTPRIYRVIGRWATIDLIGSPHDIDRIDFSMLYEVSTGKGIREAGNLFGSFLRAFFSEDAVSKIIDAVKETLGVDVTTRIRVGTVEVTIISMQIYGDLYLTVAEFRE